MTPVLQLCSVSAGYKRVIVHDISLTVAPGELICLLGPNGCGKTTLLRSILGSARITAGEIWLNGKNAAALTVRKRAREAALVAQLGTGGAGLCVTDILAMGAYAQGNLLTPPDASQREHIRKIADRFGITRLLECDFSSLSAGQRQLVQLARAAVQNTPLLLLDEPNSALDFANSNLLFDRLASMRSAGTGGLIVLHDPALALRHADRILTMREGGLLDEILPQRDSNESIEMALRRLYPGIRILREAKTNRFFCDTADVAE